MQAANNLPSIARRAAALVMSALLALACVPVSPTAALAADPVVQVSATAESSLNGAASSTAETASTDASAAEARPAASTASGAEAQTVRVGWLSNNEGFQDGAPGEYLSGWGYEYLQTLSYYAPAWKYEYVEGTFNELMDKLEAGEIDLMPNISYTEERAEKLLYSTNPQGTEHYYIYTRPGNDALTQGDPSALNGMTIGCNPGVMQTDVSMQWIESQGVTCDYRFYDTGGEVFSALSSGEVDAIIMNDTLSSDDAMPVFSTGESSYYFVTPKSRPDLMEQINAAMTSINAANPRYNDEVKTRYSVGNSGSSSLTGAERSWLAGRGDVIKMGYLADLMPYCDQNDEGQLTGALSALVDTLENQFDVKVETVAYSSNPDMRQALADGAIDVAAPLFKDYWIAEQADCIQSTTLATTSLVAVYLGDSLDEALGSIACASTRVITESIIGLRWPQAEIVDRDTTSDCVEAVKTGAAGCTILPVTALNAVRENVDLGDLKTAELPDAAELTCWMRKGDHELLSVVNKAVISSQDAITAGTYSYATPEEDKPALAEFIEKHQSLIVVSVLVALMLTIIVLTWSLRSARAAERKAQSASTAKTAFLSRMSHDIRTPLNGIIGLMEISDLHPDDAKLATQNRAKSKVAANHLLTLINDILEMSKIEDRAIVLEHEPFNLDELIRDVYVIGKLRASERGVTIALEGVKTLSHPDVYGSPVHVRRILLNLVDNCIKYNKPGGSVTCTAIDLGAADDVATCRFIISDTGIGMTQEFLEHIFEPFTQANDDARSNFQGTGMGMPIVKGLVEEMGGTIEATSTLGKGSSFTVTLPFTIDHDPKAHREQAENPENCSLEGMSVMLVEDNDLNTEIARTLLESEGVQVSCASDGKEAVDLFCSRAPGSFDAILMDVMMPKMNGYEATRAIRVSDRLDAADVPIVAMTANAFAEDVRAAREAGMNDHISKPIELDRLKSILAKYRRR